MTPQNAPFQLLPQKANQYQMKEVGDGGTVRVDRQFGVLPIVTAAAETRVLAAPAASGIFHLETMVTDGGDAVVTVKDSAGSTTGTITFNDAADWAFLVSIEASSGVFAWRVVATYGTTNTVPTATTNTTATGVTYAGVTGANDLVFPTNLADAMSVVDSAAVDFLVFVSTTNSPAIQAAANITMTNATTPFLATAAGKTNTGYVQVNGKTSGALKITTADATAYTFTVTVAAQTVGTATATIPNLANVSDTFAMVTLAQTLVNKTLTAPTINLGKVAANNTPVAATGSDLAGAAAVGAQDVVTISSDSAGKGVKLLTGVAGQRITIINTTATACKLYPAAGGTIDGLTAGAAVTIAASKRYILICTAADTWFSMEAAAATAV